MSRESPENRAGAAPPFRSVPASDRLRFSGDNAFQNELRRRVEEFFRDSGRRPRDSVRMYLKTTVILAAFAVSYVLLVFVASSWWEGALYSIALGVAMAQIGFNVQHDAGHQAYSEHRWVNRTMAMTLDMIGGSSYIWHWKHAVFHHTYVNVSGHDSDIDLGALARLAPPQRLRWLHRWQHYYLWVLYGVTVMRWHFYGDFRDMATGTIGERRFPRPQGRDLAVFVIGKIVFFTLAFGLPLAFHSLAVVAAFYAIVAAITGLLLALVFQMAHVVEEAEFPAPAAESGRVENAWAIHQLETTVDFARNSRWVTWLVGGLNFQIEHHLFARICHVHYPAMSGIVEQTCREFGVKYSEHTSLRTGILSHYRWLRRMSVASPATAMGAG
jgi:linoleoyl-CoA desaturase